MRSKINHREISATNIMYASYFDHRRKVLLRCCKALFLCFLLNLSFADCLHRWALVFLFEPTFPVRGLIASFGHSPMLGTTSQHYLNGKVEIKFSFGNQKGNPGSPNIQKNAPTSEICWSVRKHCQRHNGPKN